VSVGDRVIFITNETCWYTIKLFIITLFLFLYN
jgi:hypothetical protein